MTKGKPAPIRNLGARRGPAPVLVNRPDAGEILEELRKPGANLTTISKRIGVSRGLLQRFRDQHIPPGAVAALSRMGAMARPELQLSALEWLAVIGDKAQKLLDAADRRLTDPADPTRYSLDPSTHEVTVIVEDVVPGPPLRIVRRVEKLSTLLDAVEQGLGVTVIRGEVKVADPRTLLLDAVATLRPLIETIGKARGEIRADPPAVQIGVFLGSPDWQRLEAALLEALRPCPRCLDAAGRALATIGGQDDGR